MEGEGAGARERPGSFTDSFDKSRNSSQLSFRPRGLGLPDKLRIVKPLEVSANLYFGSIFFMFNTNICSARAR